MKRDANLIVWALAVASFFAGIGLLWFAQSNRIQADRSTVALAAMQQESLRLQNEKSALPGIEKAFAERKTAPQVSTEKGRTTFRVDRAPANAVFAAINAIEHDHGARVSAVALAFPAPGLVSGTIEIALP